MAENHAISGTYNLKFIFLEWSSVNLKGNDLISLFIFEIFSGPLWVSEAYSSEDITRHQHMLKP